MDQLLSTTEAAALLGLSRQRVLVFCQEGRLAAARVGRAYKISRADLAEFASTPRPTGRPPSNRK